MANMIKGQTKLLSQQRQLNSLQNVENQLTFPHDLKNDFDQVTILDPKKKKIAELTSLMREQWLLLQQLILPSDIFIQEKLYPLYWKKCIYVKQSHQTIVKYKTINNFNI